MILASTHLWITWQLTPLYEENRFSRMAEAVSAHLCIKEKISKTCLELSKIAIFIRNYVTVKTEGGWTDMGQ